MMSASDAPPPPPPGSSSGRSSAATSASRTTSSSSSSWGARMVRPSPVTEKSLLESVAGFINEVQSLNVHGSSGPSRDPKVKVTWARFEIADVNDIRLFVDGADVNGNAPALLLILGYTQGVQIWLVPPTGEAQEVLSWKQGVVKTLRILPTPETRFGFPDNCAHCRPLICLADSTGPSTPFSAATFISLKTGEQVHHIKFNNEIMDLVVNRHVVVATFKEKLAVFDSSNFTARFHISYCYPSPGIDPNPVSLGDRWLAYADQRLLPMHRSFGGLETDSSQSMAAWGINVGSRLAQGVSKLYSNFFSSSSSPSSSPSTRAHHQAAGNPNSPTQGSAVGAGSGPQKGVVTVLDVLSTPNADGEELALGDKIDGVVAHFIAHNRAIAAMKFDSTGNLLLTCDSSGNHFNLFRILPFPAGSSFSAVHHLYSLYRGDTPGSVQDIAFSSDNRLVAVSTLRGTTHIFPITPYGGPVGVRTHTAPRVVNRLSRFHRSAGIDEHRSTGAATSSGRNSPNPSLPGTSPVVGSLSKLAAMDPAGLGLAGHHLGGTSGCPLVIPYPNPYIPPFPTPTMIQPLAQLRQPYIVTLTNQTIGSASSVSRKKSVTSPSSDDAVSVRLAVAFAPSRAWLVGTQHQMFSRQQKRTHESLFVVGDHSILLEYTLDVIPDPTLPKEKICESSPIELHVTAHGQWALTQPRDSAYLQPPLPAENPLMMAPGMTRSAGGAGRDRIFSYAADPHHLHHHQAPPSRADDSDDEDRWLSQVEITTHVGPHRRLWMGPQFCFKTLQPAAEAGGAGDGPGVLDLDISLPNRPEQSTPVNMPASMKQPTGHGRVPVLIEASSASSFELSPRFSHLSGRHGGGRGSREALAGLQDVEHELQEAMSETVVGEESLDGTASASSSSIRRKSSRGSRNKNNDDEEFFCLTPEDCRSIGSAAAGGRSRNASNASQSSAGKLPVQMELPDTKIFSVAVEQGRGGKGGSGGSDAMRVCSVDTSGRQGRCAVVSAKDSPPEEKLLADAMSEDFDESRKATTTNASKRSKEQEEHQPILKAVTEPAEPAVLPTVSAGAAASKKSKRKNKKKQSSKYAASSSDDVGGVSGATTGGEEEQPTAKKDVDLLEFDSNTAKVREVTPKATTEETGTLVPATSDESAKTSMKTHGEEQSGGEMSWAKVTEASSSKADLDNNSADEFVPAPRGHLTGEEEEDDDEEEEDVAGDSPSFAASHHRDESEAIKPAPLPGWLDDLLTKSEGPGDAIIKGIETSGKKWSGGATAAGDDDSMTKSGGFSVSTAAAQDDNSSEDDFDFRPAFLKKRKDADQDTRSRTSSFADSESSLPAACSDKSPNPSVDSGENRSAAASTLAVSAAAAEDGKEGWSFEADDLDVDKLIDEVVGRRRRDDGDEGETDKGAAVGEGGAGEEKTPLEDVFKFDSEMATKDDEEEEDDDDEDEEEAKKKKALSLEDLKDAVDDADDADDKPQQQASKSKKMSTSLNVTFDEESLITCAAAKESLMQARSSTTGGSTSESSVGSSPNPKKNSKGKKKKKKKNTF